MAKSLVIRDEVLHGESQIYDICVDPIKEPAPRSPPDPRSVCLALLSCALLASGNYYALKLAYGPLRLRTVPSFMSIGPCWRIFAERRGGRQIR